MGISGPRTHWFRVEPACQAFVRFANENCLQGVNRWLMNMVVKIG
jgi:hypothetical protein